MRSSIKKQAALRALAKKRQNTSLEGYFCLRKYGAYECDYVSPWSKSAHNVDASIMVVGHDWASETRLLAPIDHERVELGYDPTLPTNVRLQDLLLRNFGLEFCDVYATNAFPFIKPGKMQGSIRAKDMQFAVKEFLLPQIEIIEPRLVICLGLAVYNALQRACGHDIVRPLAAAIGQPFVHCYSKIVAVAHTGTRGTNNRGRMQVEKDWQALKEQLGRLRSGRGTCSAPHKTLT